MAFASAQQNESVDALAYRILGNTDAVEQIYKLNPGLASHGAFLPQGTRVQLPDTQQATTTAKKKRLWD